MRKTIKLKTLFLALTCILIGQVCNGQLNSCDNLEKEWINLHSKIFSFIDSELDSLLYYSDLFSSRVLSDLKRNPSTIECNFKTFNDFIGSVVTTSDGLFRIYSWDTQTGGTMRNYKNLYQFKSGNKVYAKEIDYGEGDMGTYFTDVYSLVSNNRTYILAFASGTESSRYSYEFITVFSVSDSTLNDKIQLFKTSNGIKSSFNFEYDVSSIENRPEGQNHLIKFDKDKKILYVPIILEDEKFTNKYVAYKFTGQYFEEILPNQK